MSTTAMTGKEKRPGIPAKRLNRTAKEDAQEGASTMEQPTAHDHTDLDKLDRLADSIRGYRTSSPLNREDLNASDVTEVEELAERLNVLPITILFVAQMLANDSEDMITADVFRFFDTARRDARRMGLRLPQGQAPAEEAGR